MNTRRWGFIAIGVVALCAAALAGSILWVQGRRAIAAPGPAPSAAIPGSAMAPLAEAPCTTAGSVRTCDVWALTGTLTMPDSVVIPVYGFGISATAPAVVPGPVITVTPGMTLEVVLHNQIVSETAISLDFPGQEGLVPDLTGVPYGGVVTYTFSADAAGTFVYEAGLTDGGARQVAMGLAGPLIVEEPSPTWTQEVLLTLGVIDPAFNTDPQNASMNSFRPKYWLINGKAFPDVGWVGVMTDTTVLLRYLNLGLDHHTPGLLGLGQQVIASDGETLPFPEGAVAPAIMPGQTLDALVEIPAGAETDTLYPLYNASLHQHNNSQRITDDRVAFGGMLTFLRVTAGGPAGPAGPVPSNVSVTPQRTTGVGGVQLSATLTDAAEDVVQYEFYVDDPGTLTGIGAVGTPGSPVTVTVNFLLAQLNTLETGTHVLYIRGQDAASNWGPFGSAVLNLDKLGPAISGMSLYPNPSNGDLDVLVRATGDERRKGDGTVDAGYYRWNGSGWLPMSLNRTGASVAAFTATIPAVDLAGAAEGEYLIEVRAQDDLGNWSLPFGATALSLDKTGPDVLTATLTPDTLDFTAAFPPVVMLRATIEDPPSNGVQSPLADAEAFIGTQGAPGTGFALYPSDGLFDEVQEDVYYSIPTAHFGTLGAGVHQVLVVGLDESGNWGPAGSADIDISGSIGALQRIMKDRIGPVSPRR